MNPRARVLALVALLAGLFAAETVGLYFAYARRAPGGNDLLPRWVATRAWLLEGLSPYDPEIDRRTQVITYGRPARPGEDEMRYAYLPYAMLFVAPVALLPFSWAHAAWMTALQFCLAAMCVVSMRLNGWTPPAWLAALLILWSIVVYPGARSIVLGQLSVIMALLILLGLYAVQQRRDVLAGILLALSTAKPTLSMLIVPYVLIWSLAARRRRLTAGLAGSFAALFAFSFAVTPDWPLAVVEQALAYSSYAVTGSVSGFAAALLLPIPGNPGEYVISGLLGLWMARGWWRSRDGDPGSFLWAGALALLVTVVASPVAATTSQPILYLHLILLLARLDHAPVKPRGLLAAGPGLRRTFMVATLAVTAVGLWWLFLATVDGWQEQPPVYLPLPFGVAVAMAAAGRPGWRRD